MSRRKYQPEERHTYQAKVIASSRALIRLKSPAHRIIGRKNRRIVIAIIMNFAGHQSRHRRQCRNQQQLARKAASANAEHASLYRAYWRETGIAAPSRRRDPARGFNLGAALSANRLARGEIGRCDFRIYSPSVVTCVVLGVFGMAMSPR